MPVYAGKYARVDLTNGEVRYEPVTDDLARKWLLGSGLAAKLFYDEMDRVAGALDPASPLLIFNGLLSGTFAPTGCRSSWCGRSPLTGIWDESNMGGHWGAGLRNAGLDGLVLTGRTSSPSYLWVHDGEVEIRDASHVWGMETYDAYDALIAETNPKAEAAVIGPAGENLVAYAAVIQGGRHHSRAAGRGGMGAVLGSKNVKGIVVFGKDKPVYSDVTRFRDQVKESNAFIKPGCQSMSDFGTAGGILGSERAGDLPIRNWQMGNWTEGAGKICGQTIATTIRTKHAFCWACPIGCGKIVEINEGPYAGIGGEGPEYEALAGFGAQLEIDDLAAVTRSNDLCNRLGLDTISASGSVMFATEAMERGLIAVEDTGGVPLAWGDAAGVHNLLEMITYRRGAGDLLAGGVRAAAERLGSGADRFAVHVKGLEVPYHDPRATAALGIAYATSSRGACHLESIAYWRTFGIQFKGWLEGPFNPLSAVGAAEVAVKLQDYMAAFNPVGMCKFPGKSGLTPSHTAQIVAAAMGWDMDGEEFLAVGERLFNLKRLINARYGMERKDDTLPHRLLNEPRPSGAAEGNLPDLEYMLEDYYALRGWRPDGTPSPERLTQLGLTEELAVA